jgi:hypothetical protein
VVILPSSAGRALCLGICTAGQPRGLAGTRCLLAKEAGFGTDQERWHQLRPQGRCIDCHVKGIANRYFPPKSDFNSLREYFDSRFDRRSTHVSYLGPELDAFPDVDRFQKGHRVNRSGCDLTLPGMAQRCDRSALVGQFEDDPTVERSVGIRVPWLRDDSQAHSRRRGRLGRDFLVQHDGAPPKFDSGFSIENLLSRLIRN